MIIPKRVCTILPVLIAGLALLTAATVSTAAREARPGDFDYYMLALSWSLSFCRTPAGNRETLQCGGDRTFSFIVHGLWPQYERGWPDYCGPRGQMVADQIIEAMLEIMPSRHLIQHQWRRHGSCSGLSQQGYFATTRAFRNRIRMPAKYRAPHRDIVTTPARLKRDILQANDWLEPDALSIHCGNRRGRARLREVRICFTRGGEARPCGANARNQCRARELVLPAVRSRGGS